MRYNSTFQALAAAQYNAGRGGIYGTSDSTASYNPLSSFVSPANVTKRIQLFDQVVQSSNPTPLQALQYSIQRSWLENGTVSQNEALMWSHELVVTTGNDSFITFLSGNMVCFQQNESLFVC